mgnify:CR=1 FL=1
MLGRKDSNPHMSGPKPDALPFGDAPVSHSQGKSVDCFHAPDPLKSTLGRTPSFLSQHGGVINTKHRSTAPGYDCSTCAILLQPIQCFTDDRISLHDHGLQIIGNVIENQAVQAGSTREAGRILRGCLGVVKFKLSPP